MSEPVDVLEVARTRLHRAQRAWKQAAVRPGVHISDLYLVEIDLVAAEDDLVSAKLLVEELLEAADA